jgi:hypothetical protein
MQQKRYRYGIINYLALLIAVFLLAQVTGCGVWDGSFHQAEYQLKFVTADGSPVNDVKLNVYKGEDIRYAYPVTDYYPGNIPVSDSNGVVIFHHVIYSLEFGGPFFFGCSFPAPPDFNLRFIKDGKVIYEVKYSDLEGRIHIHLPEVTRTVSVCDEQSRGYYYSEDTDINIIEQSLEFLLLEDTIVVKQ